MVEFSRVLRAFVRVRAQLEKGEKDPDPATFVGL